MKTIFFVHQAGAGEHLTERLVRAALGDGVRWCAFRREAGCCGLLQCKRASEFDRAGYQLFIQDCLDDGSIDPAQTNAFVLAQTREPTLQALESYGRHLAQRGWPHTIELLQSFLAGQAMCAVDFWKRWCASHLPRQLTVRAEDLSASPRETLGALLLAAGLQLADMELPRDGGLSGEVSFKTLESDPHFVRPYFVEFMNLLAEEADYLGYPVWQDRKPASGPVTTIYRARRALGDGRFEEVVASLGPFVATNPVEPEVRAVLGEALLEAGRDAEGRRTLEAALKGRPDFFDGYAVLARHAYRQGLTIEGRGVLREAMARRGGDRWVECFLEKSKLDPDLLREYPHGAELAVTRDAVVAGFTWVLGRKPESDVVIEAHRTLHDDEDLRLALIRSQEFRSFHERFEAGDEQPHAPEPGEVVTRDDVMTALAWLVGRPLRSRDEAETLLMSPSRSALRLALIGGDEFRDAYPHVIGTV